VSEQQERNILVGYFFVLIALTSSQDSLPVSIVTWLPLAQFFYVFWWMYFSFSRRKQYIDTPVSFAINASGIIVLGLVLIVRVSPWLGVTLTAETTLFISVLALLLKYLYVLYQCGFSREEVAFVFNSLRIIMIVLSYVLASSINPGVLDAIVVSILFEGVTKNLGTTLEKRGIIPKSRLLTGILMVHIDTKKMPHQSECGM